ncbi:unnamed protein product [Dibothriocephalus latus]|uniref:Uncharacterized protein n=1 Tax=Dibothriocephalus latus TaxID=60516 RepID=A0A3P7L826_DIBLA|nr:unnamed protein product [Dibothriocephalus latus]
MASVSRNIPCAHISSETDHSPQSVDVPSTKALWYIGSSAPLNTSANLSSFLPPNSHSYSGNFGVTPSDRPGMHVPPSDEQYPKETSSSTNRGICPSSPVPIHCELHDFDECRGKEEVVIDTPNLSPNLHTISSHESGLPSDSFVSLKRKTNAEKAVGQPGLQDNSGSSDIFSSSLLNGSSTDESYATTSPKYHNEDALQEAYNVAIAVPDDNKNSRTPSPRPPNKKISSWYQQSLARSYRAKVHQFQRIFKNTPVDTNRLLVVDCDVFRKHLSIAIHQNYYCCNVIKKNCKEYDYMTSF